MDAPASIRCVAHVEKIREGEDTKSIGLAVLYVVDAIDELVSGERCLASSIRMNPLHIKGVALDGAYRGLAASALHVISDFACPLRVSAQDLMLGHDLEYVCHLAQL